MTEEKKRSYISWLNDAHALEESLVVVLEKQAADANADEEMKDKLQEHLLQTKKHAKLIRSCLVRHNEDTSSGKDFLARAVSALNGMTISLSGDSRVKNIHSAYASEQVEIASYTVIRAAASELGDMETVNICDEILLDEKEMAEWLLEKLPLVTVEHLKLHM